MRTKHGLKRLKAAVLAAVTATIVAGISHALTVSNGMEAGWVLGWSDFDTGFDGADPNFGAIQPPTSSSMYGPEGAAVDPSRKTLFVADSANNRVLVYLNAVPGAGFNNRAADRVLGQPDLTTGAINTACGGGSSGTVNACGLSRTTSIWFDASANRLWVTDANNSRVVGKELPSDHSLIVSGSAWDYVIGQPDFTTATADTACGGGSSGTVNVCGVRYPFSVSTGAGRLIVADNDDQRVTFYNTADGITPGEAAVGVLGKADFVTRGVTSGQAGLGYLCGVLNDPAKSRLYVSDCVHNRVLVWETFNPASFANGAPASKVLGQPDFASTAANAQNAANGCTTTVNACGLRGPYGLAVDTARNRLFLGDGDNSRVLMFDDTALTDGEAAVRVLGQPNLTTGFGPFGAGASVSRSLMRATDGVAYDPSADVLYAVDTFNHRLLIFGDHLGDDPLVVSGGTGTTSGDTTTITSNVGASYSVTFPSGTSPLAPSTSVTVTVGTNANHPAISVSATLPVGTSKTITMPWTNDDICIIDQPGASIGSQGNCNQTNMVRVDRSGFNTDGECAVWEASDTVCRSGGTLVISGLEHSALYAILDSDQDGVDDDDDACPGTDLNGPIPTIALAKPENLGDDGVIDGCNATQILACKAGNTQGEQKYGVPLGQQDVFADMRGWAKDYDHDGVRDCYQ